MRTFTANPLERVLADRGCYVAAALTVVRAYIAAGKPHRLKPLASFEGWSDIVRSTIVWLGHADPLLTIATARDEDPELQNLAAMLGALSETIGCGQGKALTAGQITAKASEKRAARDDEQGYAPSGSGEWANPSLHEALEAIGAVGSTASRLLGKWLAKYKSRVVGKLRLEYRQKGDRAREWYVTDQG